MIQRLPEKNDSTCRYIRQVGDLWEYGIVERFDSGGNKHCKKGSASTMEKAIEKNGMALCSGKS